MVDREYRKMCQIYRYLLCCETPLFETPCAEKCDTYPVNIKSTFSRNASVVATHKDVADMPEVRRSMHSYAVKNTSLNSIPKGDVKKSKSYVLDFEYSNAPDVPKNKLYLKRDSRSTVAEHAAVQKARQVVRRSTQREMLKETVNNTKTAAKRMGRWIAQTAAAVGRVAATASRSIVATGGGLVLLVVALMVAVIGGITASPFGILFAGESTEAGAVPVSVAVAQLNNDLHTRLEALQTEDAYDEVTIQGEMADWVDVLAVFAAKDMTPLSAKTILEYHRLICAILSQAEKEMLVPYNAAKKATPPKQQQKEVNYFQPQQICDILRALDGEPLKWQLITHLLMITGARRGEIAGLKWSKFDMERRRLKVDAALLYSSEIGTYETTTKTGNRRYIPLPEETFVLLRRYKISQLELQSANGDRWFPSDYVFTMDDGKTLRPDSITQWLGNFSRRKGLPHINPHAFRHTAASVLITQGIDIVTVSKMLGHAKVSTTEDIYSRVIEESKQLASNALADVYFRGKRREA